MTTVEAQKLEEFSDITGNVFEGESLHGRPEGHGKYTFASGTVYEGEFKDAQFHGKGTLYFPGKGRYEATWENGNAIEGTYIFEDDLVFDQADKWSYCEGQDRRFFTERHEGLKPAGESKLTNKEAVRPLKDGHHDLDQEARRGRDGND